ncbi:MAG: four helix bundle protein [Akkermansia sp.]|nr:four helix bundle protein [Akkermansia sp.]MBR2314170.1 four helix bundle protein [Akkermansia sp.]
MKPHPLAEQSLDFSVSVVRFCDAIERHAVLKNQLLRSATSIGANIHEGVYACSGGDFVLKYQISLKECHETEYWLHVMQRAGIAPAESVAPLLHQSGNIRRMLIASIKTAKGK